MCGIMGYTGKDFAAPKVLLGLEVLEYRGYDSVGICTQTEGKTEIVKVKGRVNALKEILKAKGSNNSFCAMGHTRWATHGAPSDDNAHPHRVGDVSIVHNGIIENYRELKEKLISEGFTFASETDTEIACALIDKYYSRLKNPFEAISMATSKLKGSYALAIMIEGIKGTIYAVRNSSPLIIGRGSDGYYLASDLTAIIPFTKEYYALTEGEIIELKDTGAYISEGGSIEWQITEMSFESAKRGGYEHFMLKEMNEQPTAVKGSALPRIEKGLPSFKHDGIDKSFFEGVDAIHIIACGSAMHAGIVGGKLIESYAKIPVSVYIASEYRYSPPLFNSNTLVIVISQSGETADSIASLRYAKSCGLKTLSIVNAQETTIAKEADYCAYTYAGPEIAVATTKGYMTQVCLLKLLAIYLGYERGRLDVNMAKELTDSLINKAPRFIKEELDKKEEILSLAEKICKCENLFYIGRGMDYALAMEAALKLKEISYIHAEAYGAGELKHGTISLIEKGTPVIALATEERLFDKTESNLKEVKSRGALAILITTLENPHTCADIVINLPKDAPLFSAITVIQMIAYYTSYLRGCDIDRPRNLAKSVTVE